MKKIILIVSIILLVTGIIGGAVVSAPVLAQGVDAIFERVEEKMQTYNYEFDSAVKELSLDIASAKTTVLYGGEDKIKVVYRTTGKNRELDCNAENGVLSIREKTAFSFFSLFGSLYNEISITLPEKFKSEAVLSKVGIKLASGSIDGDIPMCSGVTDIYVASGKVSSTADTDSFVLNVTSGNVNISNRGGKLSSVKAHCTSGSIDLNRFVCADNSYEVTSGRMSSNGLCGNTYANVTSGSMTLGFDELCGDITGYVASGRLEFAVPENAGGTIDYSVASGSVKIDIPDFTTRLTGSGKTQFGSGSANIGAKVASGSIVITGK